MSRLYIVVDQLKDWQPYFPSDLVISFNDYLALGHKPQQSPAQRVRVINLCNSKKYLSQGYYCSLLAEARGHSVIPAVNVLNDLRSKSLYVLQLEGIREQLDRFVGEPERAESLVFKSYFGSSELVPLQSLTRQLFERFACPVLQIELKYRRGWQLSGLKPVAISDLDDQEQTAFGNALEAYSRKLWRLPRPRKRYRYEMAILVDPEEALPPSDSKALKMFVKAAAEEGIAAELIGRRDYQHLAEYDALFIRETTAINHHTYRFARKAESEGMVVIDDPTSILRCCNKVYLHDLFRTNKVPSPKTLIVSRKQPQLVEYLEEHLAYPMVLKIPDGSFSRGVSKVKDRSELVAGLKALFASSALLLVQEFMYTEFDWRIGVLAGNPLYACRYYMVGDHWQIYQHGQNTEVSSGGWDTLPTYEVPKPVLKAAVKAAKLIGDGLYGIDIKQRGNQAFVIEVNDNPSIDSDVEDGFLGKELYRLIMQDFVRRLDGRGR